MRKLILFFFILLLSCSGFNEKKVFYGYPKTLLYKGNFKNKIEQSLFEFFEESGKKVSVGSYLNGFKNQQWYYNIEDSLIQIKWAHFEDKHLGFETNVFDFADSAYYGDYYTQIDYKMNGGDMTMGVTINSPFKDYLELFGYKKLSINQVQQMGYSVDKFDSLDIGKIKIYSLLANNQVGKEIYINTAFGYVDSQHIQLTLVSNGKIKKQYNDIFFEGVLTNLYIKKQRFYFPFQEVKK